MRLIPAVEIRLSTELPSDAEYWMPSEEEVEYADEGFGFFRDVWTLVEVLPDEATAIMARERSLVEILDGLSSDADTFDRFARAAERHDPECLSDDAEVREVEELLIARMGRSWDLDGLEIGVAGLSHALASVGCVPTASCRGHTGDRAWSEHPVVYVALDRAHAEWLAPLVHRIPCGFGIDPARSEMLTINARCIADSMALAAAICEEAERNPPPPLAYRRSGEAEPVEQRIEVDGQQTLF
ncbi:hypothetical protein AB0M02_40545 [Actinoplanes sp. NPDC051861]|uniref:hypothetical protein n=1 Tax=Actinoplanes sp. NPDC051861 TaxID=3155170 RepID=UPI00344A2B4C